MLREKIERPPKSRSLAALGMTEGSVREDGDGLISIKPITPIEKENIDSE
jgi:hypothetical protein